MAIPDSDPRARELDEAFALAASGPARPRAEATTPAEVDQDAPFGRGDDGSPIAPYGLTKDGRPKRSAGGRPPKDSPDHARTATPEQVVKTAGPRHARPEPHDWTGELNGLADAAWFGMSAISKVAPNVPVIGRLIPDKKLAAQAFVLSETKPQLIAAVNLAAQHNARASAFCQRLEGGDGLWALTAMFMVMPVLSVSMTIWKGDEAELKASELPTLAEMAERNETRMDEMITRINAQIAAATENVMTEAPAAPAAA